MKVGIVGGGQLGRMLGLAGVPLGMQFRFLEPAADCPASRLGEIIRTPYDDPEGLERFAQDLGFATYEFENVPVQTARWLEERVALAPGARALEVAQDRIREKTTLRDLGVPVQAFASISSASEIAAAVERVGFPAVLKTRRMGYDGKGQRVLRGNGVGVASVQEAWDALGRVPCILEAFVPFEAEVSQVAVRARRAGGGAHHAFWPLTQNEHRAGILWKSEAPAPCDGDGSLAAMARTHVQRLMDELDYVGVIAVEFFVAHGALMANEIAPRVHNSGHWTIEGAETSQFENHLRAVTGLPLGSTDLRSASIMFNLVGKLPLSSRVLAQSGAHLHLYGKSARAGRKVGHVTLTGQDPAALQQAAAALAAALPWDASGAEPLAPGALAQSPAHLR